MTTLRDLLGICEGSLRRSLTQAEEVLASGRCEDITDRGRTIKAGGAAWTYVLVTNRRLRWVPGATLRFEASLDLDAVTRVTEAKEEHRYAIALDHPPIIRLHHVPAHRFVIFRWGNAERLDAFTRTRLAFSRMETDAAIALRAELARRSRT